MSAERKRQTADPTVLDSEEPFALRQQVAERLAAHRSRRSRIPEPETESAPRPSKSRIAAVVAERYAQSKSYRAYLAEEAERAVREAEEAARQAEAAAEIAARNAKALAEVQYNLLAELEQENETHTPASVAEVPPSPVPMQRNFHPPEETTAELNFESPSPSAAPAFTVRLAEDLRIPNGDAVTSSYRNRAASTGPNESSLEEEIIDPSEAVFLDEEIAFRQSPVFDPVEPPIEIPGNLIEFPRQLVAPRRARPRLAEGPLREESEVRSDPSQLRIFEVEAEQISPEPAAEAAAPEWSSILLDAYPRPSVPATAEYQEGQAATGSTGHGAAADPHAAQHLQLSPETEHLYAAPLAVAPISLRLMSAAVDGCILLAAFLVFTAVSVWTAARLLPPEGLHMTIPTAAMSAIGTVVLLGFLYQILFFTFSDATPGMRYARIGLCTFSDENPSRAAMRRRILALALSSASLGLGVLWALLDDERLGWHDRISRMYQRSY